MADVKNFGLVGVGSSVQFSKAGPKMVASNGAFSLTTAAGVATSLTTSALTASTGDLSVSTGNLVLTASGATVSIGGDTTLSRQGAGVFSFDGTKAFVAPVGNSAARPTGVTGMVRVNNEVSGAATVEFFNGTTWKTAADTGITGAIQTELDNVETSLGSAIGTDGTFTGFSNVTGVLVNATSFTDAIDQIANAVSTDNSLDEIFPSTSAGNVIYSNGSNEWVQAGPGATSGVQAYASQLDALSAKTSTGILYQSGTNTYSNATFSFWYYCRMFRH